MKTTNIITISICILLSLSAKKNFGQDDYRSAIGLRLGYPLSASYKQFLNESNAFEVYVGTRGFTNYNWTNISGAYQIHQPLDIEGLTGLKYYYGGGISLYIWSYDLVFSESYSSTTVGIQGYFGLDYRLGKLPLNLTLDWIPTLFLGNGFTSGFGGGYGSLGVRYILK